MGKGDVQNALTELRFALSDYQAAKNPDVGVFGAKQAKLLTALGAAVNRNRRKIGRLARPSNSCGATRRGLSVTAGTMGG
jgi:hypothetical protein